MKPKRPLAPMFLNKIDDYLLLNKPVTWTARTHLAAYYSLLFMLVLTLLCFIVPDDPRSDSSVFIWTTLTGILSALGFIAWCIYLLRFNVFKRFGEAYPFDGLKTFLLYFIAIGLMVIPGYIPPAVESIRANNAFGNDEVVNDINAINSKICQLEYDSIHHTWRETKYIVRDSVNGRYYEDDEAVATTDESASENYYKIIDTADLRNKRLTADSVVQINDSIYHFFDCPNYTFLTTYSTDEYSVAKVLSSVQLYQLIIKNYRRPDVAKVKEELSQLIKKYKYGGNKRDYYYSDMVVLNGKTSYYNLIEGRYSLPEVSASISNITQKKYRWQDNNDSRFRVWLYLTLVFTLLIFIFRHSTVKTFFLSMLTGIILLVLSALIMAFFRFDEKGMYIMMLLYYIGFFAVGSLGFNSKKRMAVAGIAINMITFFTIFLPLICVSFYYELLKDKYRLTEYPADHSTKKDFHLLIAEIAGIILLILLIEPLFKRLYRNWFSKPEQ